MFFEHLRGLQLAGGALAIEMDALRDYSGAIEIEKGFPEFTWVMRLAVSGLSVVLSHQLLQHKLKLNAMNPCLDAAGDR